MRRGWQASGDRAGVVESVESWASHFMTREIPRSPGSSCLSSSCLLALGGDDSKGPTRLMRGKCVGTAERVLVSWKPLPFTCCSEVWRRKAGCSTAVGKGVGAVSEEAHGGGSLPLVSSNKARQCASAPCLGQTGSRSTPRVDNGAGNEGERVRGRTQGSSQK